MTIDISYDKKQVIQGLRYHFLNRPEIRIMLILVNVFAIASAILLYFKTIQPISFLLFSILWFLLMLVVWRILPASIYKRSMTFKDHFVVHLNQEGMVLETSRGQKGWPWNSFTRFVETPYFFHLYFDSRSFFLIPKDCIESIPDVQEARHLMKEKIGKDS